jgi:hypothetical protein
MVHCNAVAVTLVTQSGCDGCCHLVTLNCIVYLVGVCKWAFSSSLPPRVLVTLPSMSCHSSSIPFISISPAPEEDPIVEPFSPFSALSVPPSDRNAFRPSHLTPPTSITSFKRSLSPFHPAPTVGNGLESQKFQVLLAASKQRKVSNQSVEFRKEVAMKAHKNGHCRFLRH